MKRFFQFVLPSVLTLIVVGTYSLVSAQGGRPRPGSVEAAAPRFAPPAVPPPASVKHSLQGMSFSQGNGFGTSIAASSFVPVDAGQTVNCPGPVGTCTIVATLTAETNGTAASNNFALCLYVDGAENANGCYYVADTPSDGTFVQGATSIAISGVTLGAHTVQTYIYSNSGCALFEYNFQYAVYKP